MPKGSKILELGCGCGWNLLWLAQNGFSSLTGIDIDESVLGAMDDFADVAGIQIRGLKKDIFSVAGGREKYDVIFSLNSVRLDARFDPESFLEESSLILNSGGIIIIDVIDVAYNDIPNNRYHTSDWDKPEGERRPSEHINRFSEQEVIVAARKTRFRLIKHIKHGPLDKICVNLYILSKD
jgi:cyclopropane fatty-acyl-phospholipid synthase-like methyltransferase